MRGDAVRQLQKRLEPAPLAAAIQRDVAPALGTGDYRAHRNHQDIEQEMPDLAIGVDQFEAVAAKEHSEPGLHILVRADGQAERRACFGAHLGGP